MADTNLPVPNPAPNDGAQPSSEPVAKPADVQPQITPTPASPLDHLTDEEKTYLKGQGIEDLTSPDAIRKIINHAQSSQRTAADAKNKLDKVQTTLSPVEDVNPLTNPGSSGQPQPNNPQPVQQPAAGLDQATAFLLTGQLASSFPLLKDDLVSGDFYKGMANMGLPLTDGEGKPNINGMLSYGKMVNQQRELETKLAEAGKPGEGAIPDANPTAPTQPQPGSDAPMTKSMAQAILMQDPNHARASEAQQFLNNLVVGTK